MSETTSQAIDRAAAVLRSADTIACAGHIAPDGDAAGSALGLAAAARKAGKQVVVSFGEPAGLPDNWSYLPLDMVVPANEFPREPEVMVAFDTAAVDRLGSLAAPARRAGTLIVVDHHVSNEGFGDIAVIDPAAAASAELAYRIVVAAGWEIDVAAAVSLYTGLVTDTGRFQYSSTSPSTLRVAAELLEAGVRPEVVGQSLYEMVPFGYLSLSSLVLGRAELRGDLVWSYMTKADLEVLELGYEDSDPLIDDLRIAREAGVALLLKEVAGGWKGSLRSRGRVDVGAIAGTFGGGGHHNAAGFTHAGPPEDIVAAVAVRLDA